MRSSEYLLRRYFHTCLKFYQGIYLTLCHCLLSLAPARLAAVRIFYMQSSSYRHRQTYGFGSTVSDKITPSALFRIIFVTTQVHSTVTLTAPSSRSQSGHHHPRPQRPCPLRHFRHCARRSLRPVPYGSAFWLAEVSPPDGRRVAALDLGRIRQIPTRKYLPPERGPTVQKTRIQYC